MDSPIKNVALLGSKASGIPGPPILNEFIQSSLNVTVVSRVSSKHEFPAGVNVVRVDYSFDSLKTAFTGQDAVVSLLGHHAFEAQKNIIEAAISAGVKRFIPSEFGVDTSNPKLVSRVPFVAPKAQVVEYLRSKQNHISWSALISGIFFDWGLWQGWLGILLDEKKVKFWDDGETPFATAELDIIGKALVALLSRDEAYQESANRYVHIAGHVTTQREILSALEGVTGEKYTVYSEVDAGAYGAKIQKEIAEGDWTNALDLLKVVTFDKRTKLGLFPQYWNNKLGLPRLDLEQTIREVVEGKRTFRVSDSY